MEPSLASEIFPLYHLLVHNINMDKGISSLHRQAYPPSVLEPTKKDCIWNWNTSDHGI